MTLKDKTFRLSISETDIIKAVDAVAERMKRDLEGKKPLFVVMLNGAFMFAADLLKRVEVPGQIAFVRLSSYCGTASTGHVKEIIGLNEDIAGRTVVIIEDIIDTGLTMYNMVAKLTAMGVGELKIAALFYKPEALLYPVTVDYMAMSIHNDFIVGYGLDYDGYGRNLRDIYTLIQQS